MNKNADIQEQTSAIFTPSWSHYSSTGSGTESQLSLGALTFEWGYPEHPNPHTSIHLYILPKPLI